MDLRAVIFIIFFLVPVTVSAKTLVFGIVPQQSAKKLAQNWSPLIDYLSKQSNLKLVFATAKDIPTFEQRLANAEYDFAYMNPYHYVLFSKQAGYTAIAKQKDKYLQGIIVVPKNSSIKSLADLQGQTLAFPAPGAFAATMIPQQTLAQMNIDYTARYVSSHDSVYLSVSKNLFVAGGGVLRTFGSTSKSARDQLKVLWQSKPFTPHAFAAADHITDSTRRQLVDAMLQINQDEQARQLLDAINFQGFEKAQDADWQDVKALRFSRLEATGQ